MMINWNRVKLCLTNYRWYVALVWLLVLIPLWFVPYLLITLLALVVFWINDVLVRILDWMYRMSVTKLKWANRWFSSSIKERL